MIMNKKSLPKKREAFFYGGQLFLYNRMFYCDKAEKRILKRFFEDFLFFCEKIFIHILYIIRFLV